VSVIRRDSLLENVRVTGAYLKAGLDRLSKRFPARLQNVRGRGTFLAFDVPSNPPGQARDALVGAMRQKGVQSSGCGNQTIRLRPMLTFQPKHADIYLRTLEQTLEETNDMKSNKAQQ
jgi:4-aminobutyrate aminotransferase/(S)-3-amino-2-methylpropionate transaminase